MKETVIVHNKDRKKKLVTVTSHLVLNDNGDLLEGRTYKRYSPNFPYRDQNLTREAAVIAEANLLGLPAVRLINSAPNEGTLEMEYVPGENLAEKLAHPFITQDEIWILIIKILRCIESYHNAGIILFDTHPSNFIIREDNGECIFCDFGLAFSPQNHPFSAPPPTRCDRGYFSDEQNRAIGADLAVSEESQVTTKYESNNLQPVGDIFVLANQLLSHFSKTYFDCDLFDTLKKMKDGHYQSVTEILLDLDEKTPTHLKGTPDPIPLDQLGDLSKQNMCATQRHWPTNIHPFLLLPAGVVTLFLTVLVVVSTGVFNVKTAVPNTQVTNSQKAIPVAAIDATALPEAKTPEVVPPQRTDEISHSEAVEVVKPPVKDTVAASSIKSEKTIKPKRQDSPNKQLIAKASRLIEAPSRYNAGIAILASLTSDTEARLLLSQELESARKNALSQRLSNNRKGIQALYALQSNKSLVSEKAGATIEEFYENSKSSGNIVNIIRLQLLTSKNHAGAQFALGRIHELAGVRKRNYATAYRYYTAAKAENSEAGKAVERLEQSVVVSLMQSKDPATRKEAFRLLLAIAEVPANKEAQYTVGKIYQDGALGVKNSKLARAYLNLAVRNGKEEAKKELARL